MLYVTFNNIKFGPFKAKYSLSNVGKLLSIEKGYPILKGDTTITFLNDIVPDGEYELIISSVYTGSLLTSMHPPILNDLGVFSKSELIQKETFIQSEIEMINFQESKLQQDVINIYELSFDEIVEEIKSHINKIQEIPPAILRRYSKLSDTIKETIQFVEMVEIKRNCSMDILIQILLKLVSILKLAGNYNPAVELFHVLDFRSSKVMTLANHVLNTLSCWKNISANDHISKYKKSSTLQHLMEPSKIFRRGHYVPRVFKVNNDLNRFNIKEILQDEDLVKFLKETKLIYKNISCKIGVEEAKSRVCEIIEYKLLSDPTYAEKEVEFRQLAYKLLNN